MVVELTFEVQELGSGITSLDGVPRRVFKINEENNLVIARSMINATKGILQNDYCIIAFAGVVYVFSLFGNWLNEAFKVVTHISLNAVKDTTHFPFLSNPRCKHMIALFDSRRFAKKSEEKNKTVSLQWWRHLGGSEIEKQQSRGGISIDVQLSFMETEK